MGATTYEVDSSHVLMLSKPSFVIDMIRTAAKAVMSSQHEPDRLPGLLKGLSWVRREAR
jgi:hypothetical protein